MISDQLQKDMKTALKSGDKLRLGVIRMLMSELKNARIARGEDLSETDEQKVVSSYAKKRKEAIETAQAGGRADIAEKEKNEYEITISYLPSQLGEAELKKIVKKHIEDIGGGKQAFGQVMKAVLTEVGSRADGKAVSAIVKELL